MDMDEEYIPKHSLTSQLLEVLRESDRYRATIKKCETAEDSRGVLDVIYLDFEVVGLCQYPDFDVKPVEPIKIAIRENAMPAVFLDRSDFPSVPHMNVHRDQSVKSICYSDQTYEEIRHKLNARFLLECINNWFVKTARNELHRPDQPLEPFFFGTEGIAILRAISDNHFFASFEERVIDGLRILTQTEKIEGTEVYAVCRISVPPETKNVLHRIPDTLQELAGLFPEQNIDKQVKLFISDVLSVRHNPKEFQRLFLQSLTALLKCKTIMLMDIPLARSDSTEAEQNDVRVFVIDTALELVLADFGYAKQVKKSKHRTTVSYPYSPEKDAGGKNISLKMFTPHVGFYSRSAQRLNHCDDQIANQKIAQIGAGALGSQIFLNAIRSGIYQWTLIDDDRLWPHNLARHTLSGKEVGEYKAVSLTRQAQGTLLDAECESIAENYFMQSERTVAALENADLIIDASASVQVERHLALDASTKARKASFFLNPSGNSTIMLLEDDDANVRLDLLEMQYYRALLLSPKYEKHLERSESIAYSTSCRDASSRISQNDMALSASLCGKAIKKYTPKPEAKIIIWTHNTDGVEADVIEAEPWESIECGEWKVYIMRSLLRKVLTQRLKCLPNETGGILIGSFDQQRKILYIAHQIESPDDSISSPTSYIRGCSGLAANLKRIGMTTQDNLYYVGEWHSHPTDNTARSLDDKKLFGEMVAYNRDNCRPSCMLILGSSNKSLYLAE
jgi:hypothetical protein